LSQTVGHVGQDQPARRGRIAGHGQRHRNGDRDRAGASEIRESGYSAAVLGWRGAGLWSIFWLDSGFRRDREGREVCRRKAAFTGTNAILENTLGKLILLGILIGVSGTFVSAHAQEQFDLGFAVSGLTAPSNNTSTFLLFPTPSIGGGTYLGFNGDYLFHKNFGVEGEINWRAHRNLYDGFQPYRPLFWDFNAIYAPKLGPRVTAELLAGIGV